MRGNRRRLTEEQEELRLNGLRIPARLIVHAHLDSLIDDAAEGGGGDAAPGAPPARKPLGKDGGHVR